jgi:hypothetical protein
VKLKGPRGEDLSGEQLQFTIKNEGYSEYLLSDGNTLRVRIILAEVYCLDQKDPLTGRPNYVLKSINVVSVVPHSEKQ